MATRATQFLVATLLFLAASCLGQGFASFRSPSFVASLTAAPTGGGGGSTATTNTANLVAWWKMDETSGSRSDSKGSYTLAESAASVGNASGVISSAAHFVGDKYLTAATASDELTTNGVCSYSLWVKMASKASTVGIFGPCDNGTLHKGALLYYNTTSDRFVWTVRQADDGADGSVSADTLGAVSTATWYHIACGYTGSQLWIQANAGTRDTASYSGGIKVYTDEPFVVGALSNAALQLSGDVDELGVWLNRTLTTDEVSELYNGGSGKTYTP